MVLFEVISKTGSWVSFLVQAHAKRTYTNFASLDTILNAKYSKQIRTGSLTMRKLPEQANMNNISSLGVLREQLNLYLQELLKVTIIDIETGINQTSSFKPERHKRHTSEWFISTEEWTPSQADSLFLPDNGDSQTLEPSINFLFNNINYVFCDSILTYLQSNNCIKKFLATLDYIILQFIILVFQLFTLGFERVSMRSQAQHHLQLIYKWRRGIESNAHSDKWRSQRIAEPVLGFVQHLREWAAYSPTDDREEDSKEAELSPKVIWLVCFLCFSHESCSCSSALNTN